MFTIKKLLSAASVGLLSITLMGCVGDPYGGGGYDGYYGGSTVVYSSGPRYDSRRYRNDRYYRDSYYRDNYDRRGDYRQRPSRRPDYQNPRPDNRPGTRPDTRPDRPPVTRPTNNSRGANLIESEGFIPRKREPR